MRGIFITEQVFWGRWEVGRILHLARNTQGYEPTYWTHDRTTIHGLGGPVCWPILNVEWRNDSRRTLVGISKEWCFPTKSWLLSWSSISVLIYGETQSWSGRRGNVADDACVRAGDSQTAPCVNYCQKTVVISSGTSIHFLRSRGIMGLNDK